MSEIPADLRYTAEHEWVKEQGDVVYISLPVVGATVSAGESCGEVESTKSVSDLYAPADGEIVGVNDALDSTPESVNTDPYGEGWMYDLRLADAAAPAAMLDAEGYSAILD